VFLTTHYLDEADALSDRIVIIDQGRIVASDTSENLKAQVAGDLVDLEVAADDQVASAAERLRVTAGEVEVEGRHVRGRIERAGRVVPSLLRELEAAAVTLESIEVHRPTLDDVFLTLTGRSLRDAESEAGAELPAGPPTAENPENPGAELTGVAR
jgi:ABC-2 type transport system ATP-binding protein